MEEPVRRLLLLGWLVAAGACASGSADSAMSGDEASPGPGSSAPAMELIPAEWTVAEDTSASGEVITASLQLPAARDIAGLLQDESPRLLLRCVGGRVAVFLETDPLAEADSMDTNQVLIQLDSAPSCE
jgi:hypothetical protein